MTESRSPFDRRAEALFADYLARCEASEDVDFEAFCREHGEHAADLRELKAQWDSIEPLRRLIREPGPLSERLRRKFGEGVDPEVDLGDEGERRERDDRGGSRRLFKRLRDAGPKGTRYRIEGEIARGGMGAILKVWDDDLRRALAMKVVLGRDDPPSGETPAVDPKTLGRFLEEAQVTGQLDHPGIVPVHELGLGADGRVYFTMRLIKGEDLRAVFELVREEKDGWSKTRALGVLLKVCEAMSYAHAKGVIHRDLKPANVMVGKFGEVYVMDWGLARVLGKPDRHDVRIRLQPSSTLSEVRTERREARDETPDSPIVTMDGDIVGTPSYMPPEQAKGQLDRLGPHSDVYSLGAMIYQLLAGEMPYVPRDARISQRTVLMRVIEGPPRPLHELAPDTPAELVAVCEKAMARDPERRYRDVQELGDDLRAYLERRVVRAYESGPLAEARKWAQRNRAFAFALSAFAFLLIAGLVVTTRLSRQARAYAAETDALIARRESLHSMRLATKFADMYTNRDEALSYLNRVDDRHRGWLWHLLQNHIMRRTYSPVLSPQDGVVVYDIKFSPDGTRLVSGGGGHSINVWSLSDYEKVASLQTRGHIFAVSYSRDGQRVAAAGSAGQLVVWTVVTGKSAWCYTSAEEDLVFVSFVPPDAETVVAVSRSGRVMRWDSGRGSSAEVVFEHGADEVLSAAFLADKNMLALGTASGRVRLFDLRSNIELDAINALDGNVLQLEFAEGGNAIVSGGNRAVRIHEGLGVPRLVDAFHANAVALAVASDKETADTIVFAGGEYGKLFVYGARSGALFFTSTLGQRWITAIAADDDCRRLAVVVDERLLLIPLKGD